jgi:hypothetical protein
LKKRYNDLTGNKYGRLLVIGVGEFIKTNRGDSRTTFKCVCDCGNTLTVRADHLKSGNTKSCGCLDREKAAERMFNLSYKHGLTSKHKRLYALWTTIKTRCYNKNRDYYNCYGGRNIKVCPEWDNNPVAFVEWALANGYKKGLQIDRIDNDGDYSPDNCHFVTSRENSLNRRLIFNNNTSGYRGVSFNKSKKRYIAKIKIKGKDIYLGAFKDKRLAALAYNCKAYFYGYPLNELYTDGF